MFYICLRHYTLFIHPLLLDSDLQFVRWSTKSPFGYWPKSFNTLSIWFFTEHVNPLFIMTRVILLLPPWLHQEKALLFFFFFFLFFLTCLSPFSLSRTLKKMLYIFMTRRVFWIQMICREISHPILGRPLCQVEGVCLKVNFLPVTVCTLNKNIFLFTNSCSVINYT